MADTAAPGATIYTDEAKAYRGVPFRHEIVCYSAGEYVRGQAGVNSQNERTPQDSINDGYAPSIASTTSGPSLKVPLRAGGDPWDPGNLEAMCDQCHAAAHTELEIEPEVTALESFPAQMVDTLRNG